MGSSQQATGGASWPHGHAVGHSYFYHSCRSACGSGVDVDINIVVAVSEGEDEDGRYQAV